MIRNSVATITVAAMNSDELVKETS